ncbi:hypothetical protein DMENIID0001_059160 [Sergentomyia squamirostris]
MAEEDFSSETLEKSQILRLNEDCLLRIFSHFDVVDLIDLESVCQQFTNVIHREYKRHRQFDYKELVKQHGENRMTLDLLNSIAERIGPNLQKVNLIKTWFSKPDDDVNSEFLAILQHCNHLEWLCFPHNFKPIFADETCQNLLMETSERLKTVKMDHNSDNKIYKGSKFLMDDERAQFLLKATHLESLSLKKVDIHGTWFESLPKLKEVILTMCEMNSKQQFLKFCKRQTTLEALELTSCNFFNDTYFEVILEHLKSLKHLNITSDQRLHFENLRNISNLPQLTNIKILGIHPVEDLLEGLAERNILEHLTISESNMSLSEKDIKPLKKLQKLKSLTINLRYSIFYNFFSVLPTKMDALEDVAFLGDHRKSYPVICHLVEHYKSLKNIRLGVIPLDLVQKLKPIIEERPEITFEFTDYQYTNSGNRTELICCYPARSGVRTLQSAALQQRVNE